MKIRFVEWKHWWDYDKSEIMSQAYWLHRLLPPSDPVEYEEEWLNIKKQLIEKFGNGEKECVS